MSAHASAARINPFVDARRKVAVEDLVRDFGVKLLRQGAALRGPCPLCDGGGQRFAVKGEKWVCYGTDCGHGDVVDLALKLARAGRLKARLDDELGAALYLLGEDVRESAPRERREPVKRDGPSASDRTAAEIWAGAQPLGGTLAEAYLIGRGIAGDVVDLAAANLRYHGAAKHHWDADRGRWVMAPAMVAQVVVAGPDGAPVPTGGTHVTYLDRATKAKARITLPDGRVAPAKKMWGRHRSADGRPGGAWLIGPAGIGGLAVAEGIETGLSVVTLAGMRGVPLRACAALAIDRLQGRWLRDADNCIDPQSIEADPEGPAFTWPKPATNAWGEVLVAVDRDMSPLTVTARTGRGKPCSMQLDGEARARICGRLAVAAWAATGVRLARAIQPPPRSDFNDELRRRLARGVSA